MATVTVIDDEAGLVELMELILTSRGYHVHGFVDSRQALTHLRHKPSDLTLLDLMMPGLSGWQLLHELETSPETSGLPVVLISAFPDHEPQLMEWVKAGAIQFLPKPFDIDHLLRVAEQLLEDARRPGYRQQLSERRAALSWVS